MTHSRRARAVSSGKQMERKLPTTKIERFLTYLKLIIVELRSISDEVNFSASGGSASSVPFSGRLSPPAPLGAPPQTWMWGMAPRPPNPPSRFQNPESVTGYSRMKVTYTNEQERFYLNIRGSESSSMRVNCEMTIAQIDCMINCIGYQTKTRQ